MKLILGRVEKKLQFILKYEQTNNLHVTSSLSLKSHAVVHNIFTSYVPFKKILENISLLFFLAQMTKI